jgi:hypothetical protein
MPGPFALTTPTNTLRLDAQRRSEAVFTATNESGLRLPARARITALTPAAAPWLTLDGPVERVFDVAATQQFTVQVAVPPTAPVGTYSFRLDVYGIDNPDEAFSEGPPVTVAVPAPPPPVPRRRPNWLPLAVGVGVLLVLVAAGGVGFLVLRGSPACAPRPPGLVSWYPGDGAATDLLGGPSGVFNGPPEYVPGLVHQAFLFNGTSSFVEVTQADRLVLTGAGTVDAWIYPTGPGTPEYGGIIVNKEGEYEVARYADGTIRWAFANTDPGWVYVNTAATAPLNTWTHVAVVYDAGRVITYLNGAEQHRYTGQGTIGDAEPRLNDLRLGGRSGATQFFQGRIDEVDVFNRAVTAAEVQRLYAAGSNGKCPPRR